MNSKALNSSLQADNAWYEAIFSSASSTEANERLHKQMINDCYQEAALIEARLRQLEYNVYDTTELSTYSYKFKANQFNLAAEIANGQTLLVGEGNLSFTVSLTKLKRISPTKLVATTMDKLSQLSDEAKDNTKYLESLGVVVRHGIDATKLAAVFGGRRFDSIVFQFPHAGSREPVEGRNPNFVLLRDFLKSALTHLTTHGKVFVSAVDNQHYQGAFQFDEAADAAGFLPPKAHPFDPLDFPEYEHTMTHQTGNALEAHEAFSTWVFIRR